MATFISEISAGLSRCWSALCALANTDLKTIADATANLREMTPESVLLRLGLAIFLGGLIGLERGRKNRPAGFRTYMVVCIGATLTMILGQYELQMLRTTWATQAQAVGVSVDVSRFGAQVINGIGFLGAGTILVTGKQQVKGLTTAASLWASACMGLALGAGFYECVLLAFVIILIVVLVLPWLESHLVEKARNMNIYMELRSLDHINDIIAHLKKMGTQIYDMDIERGSKSQGQRPNAVFSVGLSPKHSHAQVIAVLSQLDGVLSIEEI